MRKLLVSSIICLVIFILSCKKDIHTTYPPLPVNPYDSVDYGKDSVILSKIDSGSFVGLHEFIFSKKCAQPACHDGTFEPDFRTLQSTYNTLIFHPVVKNNSTKSFTYRVKPGDVSNSWLHERITTNDKVLGKMPLYDTLLPRQIELITNWIKNGAKDMFGNTPSLPNPEPSTFGIVAYEPDNGNYRVDTIRGRYYEPFEVPKNTNLDIWFGLYDDKTYPFLFGVDQVKFSTNPFDFSSATTKTMKIETTPKYAPGFDKKSYPYFLHSIINTNLFKPGETIYMRVYVKDEDHTYATEIPKAGSDYAIISYFSFKIGL